MRSSVKVYKMIYFRLSYVNNIDNTQYMNSIYNIRRKDVRPNKMRNINRMQLSRIEESQEIK